MLVICQAVKTDLPLLGRPPRSTNYNTLSITLHTSHKLFFQLWYNLQRVQPVPSFHSQPHAADHGRSWQDVLIKRLMCTDVTHRSAAELAAFTKEQQLNCLTYLIKSEHVLTAEPSSSCSACIRQSDRQGSAMSGVKISNTRQVGSKVCPPSV